MEGKEKCKILKELRKRIADLNGIEYTITNCSNEANCLGTCAQCDAEIKYLEEQIQSLIENGDSVNLIGIADNLFPDIMSK